MDPHQVAQSHLLTAFEGASSAAERVAIFANAAAQQDLTLPLRLTARRVRMLRRYALMGALSRLDLSASDLQMTNGLRLAGLIDLAPGGGRLRYGLTDMGRLVVAVLGLGPDPERSTLPTLVVVIPDRAHWRRPRVVAIDGVKTGGAHV